MFGLATRARLLAIVAEYFVEWERQNEAEAAEQRQALRTTSVVICLLSMNR